MDSIFSFINFSSTSDSPELFSASDIITIDEPDLITISHFDYDPRQDRIIKIDHDLVEGDDLFKQHAHITTLHPISLQKDTLVSVHSEIISDSIFVEKEITQVRYDSHSDAIYFLVKQRYMKYNAAGNPTYEWTPSDKQELNLFKLDSNLALESVIFIQNDEDHLSTLTVSENFLFLNSYQSIAMYDKSGNYIRSMSNLTNPEFSASGNSLIYNDYTMYYNITEDYTIDLSQYVSDISFSQPYEEFILIVENTQRLHMFSVEEKEIIQSVSTFNMPKVQEKRDKISQLGLYYPVLTDDNKIRLIYTDLHYTDDPDDDCEITPVN